MTFRTAIIAVAATTMMSSAALAANASKVQGEKFNSLNPTKKIEDTISSNEPCDKSIDQLAKSVNNEGACLKPVDKEIGPKTPMRVDPMKPKG